jgi:hypothetical protein
MYLCEEDDDKEEKRLEGLRLVDLLMLDEVGQLPKKGVLVGVLAEGVEDQGAEVTEGLSTVGQHVYDPLSVQVNVLKLLVLLLVLTILFILLRLVVSLYP